MNKPTGLTKIEKERIDTAADNLLNGYYGHENNLSGAQEELQGLLDSEQSLEWNLEKEKKIMRYFKKVINAGWADFLDVETYLEMAAEDKEDAKKELEAVIRTA